MKSTRRTGYWKRVPHGPRATSARAVDGGGGRPLRDNLPGPGEAALWTVRLDTVPAGRPERVLDRGEIERAAAFRDSLARRRYVASHVALRTVLGGCLGIAPGEVRLTREICGLAHCRHPHGRPALSGANPSTQFSLSRSGDLAVVALARAPVGVDVQSRAFRHPDSPLDGMIRRLHPAERAALAELPPARREEGFLSCWVRKEAYLKGMGTGLPGGLARQCVGLAPELVRGAGLESTTSGWTFFDLDLPPDHRAALAVAPPSGQDGEAPPAPLELTVRTLRL